MTDVAIGPFGVAASLVLVVVAIVLSRRQGLRLEKAMVVASARAIVQLLAVGGALAVLLAEGRSIWWSWLWVAVIVLFAAYTVRQRAQEVPRAFGLALASTAAAGAATLGVIFGLGIFPLEPRYLVPTAGMMVGNAMSSTVVASRRVITELRQNRPEIEARLALGQTWRDASRPYIRSAVRTAVTPQIETTRTVGLVFLPGAMTGLILAGVTPLDAVLVQAAVMYLILGAVATTSAVVGVGLTRRLFTRDHRLIRIGPPGSQ